MEINNFIRVKVQANAHLFKLDVEMEAATTLSAVCAAERRNELLASFVHVHLALWVGEVEQVGEWVC